VLGIAPIDRLGELTWLGPSSVVIFGLLLGLVAHAFAIRNYDRWMLLLVLGTFTGAYPLMYFAQEFIPLNAAIFSSSVIVLLIIAVHSVTIMSIRLAIFGTVFPAAAILAVTLVAATHTRLEGIIITGMGMAIFILAMLLIPRLKREKPMSNASQPAISKRVRQTRRKCQPPVSQDGLAGRLAAQGILIDRSAISRIENEDRYLMDYEVAAIASALKVPVARLFGESD